MSGTCVCVVGNWACFEEQEIKDMADPLPLTHLRPALVLNLVTLVVTLTLSGGRVTGLPFLYERPSSRSSRTPSERMADGISSGLEHLTAQLQAQGAQITDLGTQLAKVTQSVSFTVTFSGRDIGDLGKDEALKFDRVLFNAGDGYSQRTGFFTAPQGGLYAFSLQVSRHSSDPSSCVEVDLVHSFTQQSLHPTLSQQQPQPHPASPKERHQLPSDLSKQQQQQQSLSTLPNNHHDDQQQQQQQQSSSALLFKQQQITSALLCLHDDNSTSIRAVVRLAQGDTVHARMRSGTMLLGEVFTSMSGLKLPALSPLFRPLLH